MSYFFVMPPDELDAFMAELKAWADQARHGDQVELAEKLGVSRQRLNNWTSGRRVPGAREVLKLQAFLRKAKAKK